jgi:single-strand DNA-binding protein
MIDNTVTVVGNLTTHPELRFTSAGTAVANFTVASSPRVFDKESSQWRDGDTLFLRCTVWQQAAENLADSLTKGARVIVSGRLRQHSFETHQGDKRTSIEL